MKSNEARGRERVLGGVIVAGLLGWAVSSRAFAGPDGHDFAGIYDSLLLGHDRWHGLGDGRLAWCLTTSRGEMWRPLFWLALGVEHGLVERAATAIHLTSALLHAAAFVLVAILTGAAIGPAAGMRSRVTGIVVATLWFVHPLRVEPVACASQQGTLIGTVLLVTAALLWLGALAGPGWQYGRAAAAALVLCGALTADPTLCLAPVAFHALASWVRRRSPPSASGTGPAMGVASAVGLVVLVWTLSHRPSGASEGGVPLLASALAGASAIVRPLRATLWPVGLHPGYDPPAGFPGEIAPSLWMDAVTATALVGACAWGLRRRHGLATALLAYLALVAGSLLLRRGPVGADGDSYAATIPFFVAGGVVVSRWCESPGNVRWIAALAALAGSVGLAVTTSHRSVTQWKDESSIAKRVVEIDPTNEVALVAMGDSSRRSGAPVAEFVHWYGLVVEHGDWRPLGHARLGGALLQTGDSAGARRHLDRAIVVAPWLAAARFDLGALEMSEGHLDAARTQLEAAAHLDAESAETWRLLSQARDATGDRDGAIEAIGRATKLVPGDAAIQEQARRLAK